jgi:hypothetical protein
MIQAFKNKNKIQHEVQKDTGRYKWHKNLFILAIPKIDHYILTKTILHNVDKPLQLFFVLGRTREGFQHFSS